MIKNFANGNPNHETPTGENVVISCPTGFGVGGLGQHLRQILVDHSTEGKSVTVYSHGGIGTSKEWIDNRWEKLWFRWPPFRFRPDLRVWARHLRFDREVASRLTPAGSVTAFMGGALATFQRARAMGIENLVLEMPNSHPRNVMAQHAKARIIDPLERSWMGELFTRRVEQEMSLATEIRVNSEYTRSSVLERGAVADKITRRWLESDSRFSRVVRKAPDDGTRVLVVVGSLSVFKGIPFLVDLFRELRGADLRLRLVGGWSSRGMRKYLEKHLREDSRISCASGDPAPILAQAELALHPSWEDGWAYAPAEALDAGLPVVVSDQTGMKELLNHSSMRGLVLPAGDRRGWGELLQAWVDRRLPLTSGGEFSPP